MNVARQILELRKEILLIHKQQDTVIAEIAESSMEKRLVAKATKHFRQIIQPFYLKKFHSYADEEKNDESTTVENIFKEIRGFILQEILEDAVKYARRNNDFGGNHEQIVNIACEFWDELILGQAEALDALRPLVLSNTNVTHIAWRNFDQDADTFKWDNLLLPPSNADKYANAFSMRETGIKQTNLFIARKEARLRLAYYFLAINDTSLANIETRKLWHANFIGQLADIRRAHNDNIDDRDIGNADDIDAPSCFPGIISRLANMGMNHPVARIERDRYAVITEVMRKLIEQKFAHALSKLNHDVDKTKLYDAVTLLSSYNAESILKNSKIAQFSNAQLSLRYEFKGQFGRKNRVIYKRVNKLLSTSRQACLSESEKVYVRYMLADLGGPHTVRTLTNLYLHSLSHTQNMHQNRDCTEDNHALHQYSMHARIKQHFMQQGLRADELNLKVKKIMLRQQRQISHQRALIAVMQAFLFPVDLNFELLQELARRLVIECTANISKMQLISQLIDILCATSGTLGKALANLNAQENQLLLGIITGSNVNLDIKLFKPHLQVLMHEQRHLRIFVQKYGFDYFNLEAANIDGVKPLEVALANNLYAIVNILHKRGVAKAQLSNVQQILSMYKMLPNTVKIQVSRFLGGNLADKVAWGYSKHKWSI